MATFFPGINNECSDPNSAFAIFFEMKKFELSLAVAVRATCHIFYDNIGCVIESLATCK